MAEPCSSDVGLVGYLARLTEDEFWRFKERLRDEAQKFQLAPIPQCAVENASREELARLLAQHYPGRQAWVVTLGLLLHLHRKDLWTMAQEEMQTPSFSYRQQMREQFQKLWARELCFQVPDEAFFRRSVRPQHTALCRTFPRPEAGAVTAVLRGPEGVGKTMLLRKLMLEWAEGSLWESRFTFVFFLEVYELNSVPEASLAELVSRAWPKPLNITRQMFSQPERTLFILDGFERLGFDLELGTDLCASWGQRQPTPVILSSLLQKKLLPKSCLLLGLRGTPEMTRVHCLLTDPKVVSLPYFSDSLLGCYFTHSFHLPRLSGAALAFVKSRPDLLDVCKRPLFCWMICSCLRWQLEAREGFDVPTSNITAFYIAFVTNALKAGHQEPSQAHNRARLRSLCLLAAEGMWTQAFVFSRGDLARSGVSTADSLLWLGLNVLWPSGEHFTFRNLAFQSFWAAMFYFFHEPTDAAVGSVAQLVSAVLRDRQSHLFLEGAFVFGLTNEDTRRELETWVGFSLSKNVKPEILQGVACLRECGLQEAGPGLLELFQDLMETEDKAFVQRVLDPFEDMWLSIREMDHFVAATACMESCRRLKRLRLCIQQIFQHPSGEVVDFRSFLQEDSNRNFRGHRGRRENMIEFVKFCQGLWGIPSLQKLDLYRCKINDVYMIAIFSTLAKSTRGLQSLWGSFMPLGNYGLSVYKALLRGSRLKQVNLYGTGFEERVTHLCDTLMKPGNVVEDLMLGKCAILTKHCSDFSSVIKYARLKRLSLVENPIGNRGVLHLCEGLKDPNCILEVLMLSYCCLSYNACAYIAQALQVNRTLSILDMGSNFLEDAGAVALCRALKRPDCSLQELWLMGCYFTSDCCQGFSTAIISNSNLKTLKLGHNKIQDSGVKVLCQALQHPDCSLQRLGLDMCQLTSDCCEDLASALKGCRSLRSLNLDWVAFDHAGVEVLCKALSHQDCALELLGLDKAIHDEQSQELLEAAEQRVPPLTIAHHPWLQEELQLRGVPKLGQA